jgi:large subunit ribosomal protein L3
MPFRSVLVLKDEKRTNKPLKGHFEASGGKCFSHLNEVRVDDVEAFELGQEIKSDIFSIGDTVLVRGKSKGRGFAGVMKRWGFGGGKKTHGSGLIVFRDQSVAAPIPQRLSRVEKCPGRWEFTHVTTKNLKVVDVRPDMDVLLLKGPVPGAPGNLLEIVKVS